MLTLQVESWKKLHDFITYALDKSKPIVSADQERQFTEIRGILLQESEHVFDELNLVAELSGKAMNVLQRASSIRGVRELSGEDMRRLETDWNFVFAKIGVIQGQLKTRRKELLGRSILRQALLELFNRKSAAR
ncbi:MAG: hypothetical protein ABI897_00365 [Spartobacteria bacterium]